MSFRSIGHRKEEFPWQWPLSLGGGIQMLRSRMIIDAIDDSGFRHQAELAPCPGVHAETLSEAASQWQDQIVPALITPLKMQAWNWHKPWFGLLDLPKLMPSVQAAAEQLLLSWASRHNPQEFTLAKPQELQGSALLVLSAQAEPRSWAEFEKLWQLGYRVFKCKISRGKAQAELAFLEKMQSWATEDFELRLDANQQLTSEDDEIWSTQCRDLPIAYWEELQASGGQTLKPTAWDESLWDVAEGCVPAAEVWILKPSRLTLSQSVYLMSLARQNERTCILSNSFDSGLSLRCAAWLYAAFCNNPKALGFGTARFLPNDSWQSSRWGEPWVTIPELPFAFL